jgi:tetrathionate reductase subunit B
MSEQENKTASRRQFIGASIAGLATLGLVPGVRLVELGNARPPEQPVTNANRWGLLIDTNKCVSGSWMKERAL